MESPEVFLKRLQTEEALKQLVYNYAAYADQRESDKQAALFSVDGTLEVFPDVWSGFPPTKAEGTAQLKKVFIDNLTPFPETMHLLGQITVKIEGEVTASGEAYCRAYHYNVQDGKPSVMIASIRYADRFKKVNDVWLFANRTLRLLWVEMR